MRGFKKSRGFHEIKVKFTSGGKSRLTQGFKFTIHSRLFVKFTRRIFIFALKFYASRINPLLTSFFFKFQTTCEDHFFV